MTRYVAFLRAINVGGHVVKMDELCKLFESLHLHNVTSHIASGNVIFDAAQKKPAAIESAIETKLQKTLGYPVAAFVRSIHELRDIARYDAFDGRAEVPPATLYIGFMRDAPGPDTRRMIRSASSDLDELDVHGRELYWLCHTKFSESAISGARLEKTLKGPITVRNSTTVRKIAEKYGEA